MLQLLDESTIVDALGRYRFLSEEAFCALTKAKDLCFVCLIASGKETQEHVIPDWIIRLCGLQNQKIILGNGATVTYPRYKLPCCFNCNQSLREQYEDPISKAVKKGILGLQGLHLSDPTLLLRWLNLLYFKTHYKDLFLRRILDERGSGEMIGDVYDWGIMELSHALLRSPMAEINLETMNIGSLYIIKILNPDWADLWDYRDDFESGLIYVRIGEIVLIGVLKDGGITSSYFRDRFCVDGGAYVAQTLEIYTDCLVFNYDLKSKPEYLKLWKKEQNYTGIRVKLPKVLELRPHVPEERHKVLWAHLEKYENLPLGGGRTLKDFKKDFLQGQVNLALNPKPPTFPSSDDILALLSDKPDVTTFYGL